MKAIAVNTYVVDVGSFRPVVVEILTDEGISGVGEGAVGFGIGCNAAAAMIKELAERFVVGKDVGGILSIWNDFYYDTFWGKGAGAIFYAAVSALEQALCRDGFFRIHTVYPTLYQVNAAVTAPEFNGLAHRYTERRNLLHSRICIFLSFVFLRGRNPEQILIARLIPDTVFFIARPAFVDRFLRNEL